MNVALNGSILLRGQNLLSSYESYPRVFCVKNARVGTVVYGYDVFIFLIKAICTNSTTSIYTEVVYLTNIECTYKMKFKIIVAII
jgi:hypothetical protein